MLLKDKRARSKYVKTAEHLASGQTKSAWLTRDDVVPFRGEDDFPFPASVWLLRQSQHIPKNHFCVLVQGFGMWLCLGCSRELPPASVGLCRGHCQHRVGQGHREGDNGTEGWREPEVTLSAERKDGGCQKWDEHPHPVLHPPPAPAG